ncbi:MAG: alpha/beta fold hydrolase [Negativicutes bacterium]|nr:alpha/beta fold hydrolase [Negativicutes bacterium]
MNIEYHKWYSPNIGRDMEFKVYGHAGKPVVVFPSSGGSFYEYEDFGMIGACRPFIEDGKIQVFTVASVDKEAWLSKEHSFQHRGWMANNYDRYICNEVTPYIRERTGYHKFMSTGCSMGAYHALNFYLRHPDIFDQCVALSGLYDLGFSVGDYMDDNVYYNSPVHYLPNLEDPWYLDQYREGDLIICAGQGAWEAETLVDTYAIRDTIEKKGIPARIEIWGDDVAHDWPWWKIQMPYFLNLLGY